MDMATEQTTESALTERALHLLKVLVESYIRDGQPVGSRTLARAAGLHLSPATIRNIMADLEEFGFLKSPHTSAGRVPTTLGYRLFVDNMIKVKPLHLSVIDQLKVSLNPHKNRHALLETASTLLSSITQLAGIVTLSRKKYTSLRQIEFLELSDNRVLAIMVVNEHEVQNRIVHLDRLYSQDELRAAANYLNAQFAGRSIREVRKTLLRELDSFRQDMDRLMRSAIELGEKVFSGAEEVASEDVFVMGQTNLMEYEELSNIEKLRQLFDAFTHKREILHLLDKCLCAEGVQIYFGQESGYEPLDDCSVVSAPYSIEGEMVGVLGVIGPTRVAYDRIIPVVDATAKLLSAALNTRS